MTDDKMREKVARAIQEAKVGMMRERFSDKYALAMADAALAAMGITDETVVVPREPTAAMVNAAIAVDWTGDDGDERAVINNVWNAMIADALAAAQEGE